MSDRERRPAEPFGGGDAEKKRAARRRPAWQSQYEGLQSTPQPQDDAPYGVDDMQPPAPAYRRRPPVRREADPYYQQPLEQEFERPQRQEVYDGEGFKISGGIMFLLIFGVGNYLLYKYTGWLIIPIPRK